MPPSQRTGHVHTLALIDSVELPRLRGKMWWAHQDSNLEPDGYEPSALTIELWAPTRTHGYSNSRGHAIGSPA